MENTVRYETDGKKLTAFFEGKINATNAAGIEKELLEQADGGKGFHHQCGTGHL